MNRKRLDLAARNLRAARKRWGDKLSKTSLESLRSLSHEHGFDLLSGDLIYLDRGWYVTHAGLLNLSRRKRCFGIETHPELNLCDLPSMRWTFSAAVYKSPECKGFIGFGDADPSNISLQVPRS